jgi:hypothetical protein
VQRDQSTSTNVHAERCTEEIEKYGMHSNASTKNDPDDKKTGPNANATTRKRTDTNKQKEKNERDSTKRNQQQPIKMQTEAGADPRIISRNSNRKCDADRSGIQKFK